MFAIILCSRPTGRWWMRRRQPSCPTTSASRISRPGNMSSRLLRQAAALAVLALLGTVAVPPANAQPSGVSDDAALDWLRAAATAPLRVSYAGTKAITVWGAQAHASQVRIYHEA